MLERIKDFKIDKYTNLGSKDRKKFFVLLHSTFTSDFNHILREVSKTSAHPFKEIENLKSIIGTDDYEVHLDHLYSQRLFSRAIDLVASYLLIYCQYDFPLLINDFRKMFDKFSAHDFDRIPIEQTKSQLRKKFFYNIFSIYEQPYRNYWEPINTESELKPLAAQKKKMVVASFKDIFTKYTIDENRLDNFIIELYSEYDAGNNPLKEYYLFGLNFITSETNAENLDASLFHRLNQKLPKSDRFADLIYYRAFNSEAEFQYFPHFSPIKEFISYEQWTKLLHNLILLLLQMSILDELENAFRYTNIFDSHVSAKKPEELVKNYSLRIGFIGHEESRSILSRYLRSICIPEDHAEHNNMLDEKGLFKASSISAALKSVYDF